MKLSCLANRTRRSQEGSKIGKDHGEIKVEKHCLDNLIDGTGEVARGNGSNYATVFSI